MAHKKPLNKTQEKLLLEICESHKKRRELYSLIKSMQKRVDEMKGWRKIERQKLETLYKQAVKQGVPKNQIAKALNMTPQAFNSILNKIK